MAPRIPLWTTQEAGRIVACFGWASAGALVVTLGLAVLAWKTSSLELIVILAVVWAVAPPVYFWYEYHFVYRRYEPDLSAFEQFKYGQQVSIAIWAGVAIALGALASSDHFKKSESLPAQKESQQQAGH